MPVERERFEGDRGSEIEQSAAVSGLVDLVDEIVNAARLILADIQIEPFDIAGVSVSVQPRRGVR